MGHRDAGDGRHVMMVLDHRPRADRRSDRDADTPIKEARRRKRRRQLLIGLAGLLVAAGGGTYLSIASSGPRSVHPPAARRHTGTATANSFLALAERGFHTAFVATYAIKTPYTTGGGPPTTLVVASAPVSGQTPSVEWSYVLSWSSGAEVEMISRPDGLYQCGRPRAASAWTCMGPLGPDRGGAAVHAAIELDEPMTQLGALEHTLSGGMQAVVATETVMAGQPARCISVTGRNGTWRWCFTNTGVLASFPPYVELLTYASRVQGTLVSLSSAVAPEQFAPPTTPSPWPPTTAAWYLCPPSRPCAFQLSP